MLSFAGDSSYKRSFIYNGRLYGQKIEAPRLDIRASSHVEGTCEKEKTSGNHCSDLEADGRRDAAKSIQHRIITRFCEPEISRGFERNLLTGDLEAAHVVTTVHEATGIGLTLDGRNAEGDPYYTDGEIKIAVPVAGCSQRSATVLF